MPNPGDAYGILLRKELELLGRVSDSYLIHEHLETHNEPIYFHDFMRRADGQGLQFLAESELLSMATHETGSEAEKVIRGFSSNVVELEQYMDFLRNRMFRQTLLCRKTVQLAQQLDARAFSSMHVASGLKPKDPAVDVRSSTVAASFSDANSELQTSDPRLKAALVTLSEQWPRALPFDDLAMRINSRLYDDPVDTTRFRNDASSIVPSLTEGYARGVVRLSLHSPVYACTLSERPISSPLARLQAADSSVVTNLLNQLIALNDLGRHVAQLADGTRREDDLLTALIAIVDRGELLVHSDSKPFRNGFEARALLADSLARCLKKLCEDALLVG